MKLQVIISYFLLILISSKSFSQGVGDNFNLDIGSTYEINNFKWSIAGNLQGNSPNILSELNFHKITSLGFFINGQYNPLKFLKFIVFYKQNYTINGSGTDIDYKNDDRINPLFEQPFKSNEGWHKLLKGGIGLPSYSFGKIDFSPAIYYLILKQKLSLRSDEIRDLQSTYVTDIYGFGLSIKTQIYLTKSLYFALTTEFRTLNYKAKANWNLIDIFQHPLSFSHNSSGNSYNLNLDMGRYLSKELSIVLGLFWDKMSVKKGVDTAYLINKNKIKTQLNGARNSAYGLKVGIHYSP